MADSYEIEFLDVESEKSGDAITVRYSINEEIFVHVIDGGYLETGNSIVEHLDKHYGTKSVDHVVLTHSDRDHANGLRAVLENCEVKCLWMNRPWLYVDELLPRFENYTSAEALRRKLRSAFEALVVLEEIAIRRNVKICDPLQGARIGAFTVMAPSRARYLDLLADSDKTPDLAKSMTFDEAFNKLGQMVKSAANLVKAAWGDEYFPSSPTSRENEMSVIQTAVISGKKIMLTGDAGREALQEAIDFAPKIGFSLPGLYFFQVPHHGGRHNVSTEVLDSILGPRFPAVPEHPNWTAFCSSAKADEHHPKMSVKRAMMHRGGKWGETEGSTIRHYIGLKRDGWVTLRDHEYPTEQES